MNKIHRKNVVYATGYHVVACTKYRRKVLAGAVDIMLKNIAAEAAMDAGGELVTIETDLDHVHMFLTAPPHVPIARIVKMIKGRSARVILQEHPHVRKRVGNHLWNPSYYVGTAGDMSSDVVRRYIDNQKTR